MEPPSSPVTGTTSPPGSSPTQKPSPSPSRTKSTRFHIRRSGDAKIPNKAEGGRDSISRSHHGKLKPTNREDRKKDSGIDFSFFAPLPKATIWTKVNYYAIVSINFAPKKPAKSPHPSSKPQPAGSRQISPKKHHSASK